MRQNAPNPISISIFGGDSRTPALPPHLGEGRGGEGMEEKGQGEGKGRGRRGKGRDGGLLFTLLQL